MEVVYFKLTPVNTIYIINITIHHRVAMLQVMSHVAINLEIKVLDVLRTLGECADLASILSLNYLLSLLNQR